MLIVGPSTSDKLQLVTDAAADIESSLSWISVNASAPPVVQDVDSETQASITTATTTDMLVGAASTKKRVGHWSIRNSHATTACNVTVRAVDGTNTVDIIKVALLAGESLIFTGALWVHYDSNGAPYTQAAKLDTKLRVVSDVTFATAATFADVTGLTVALKSGKTYCFEAHLYHISNATTTGAQFGVNIGASPTALQISTIDTVTGSVTASAHSAGSTTSRDTAATAQTTGSAAVTMGILSGYIQPSADGTFAIRCTSEVTVASGVIVKAGSWLRIWETDN
jgi:hypothetical protein